MNTAKKKVNFAELFSKFGVAVIFIIIVIVASIASNRFLKIDNLLSVVVQCSVVTVLGCGMTMLIVSGNTDLSAGSGLALGGVVLAQIIKASANWSGALGSCGWVVALLAALTVMLATSAIQGYLVSYCGLMSFIVTLAGQLAFRGLAYVVSGGAPIIGVGAISKISSGNVFGISWLIIIAVFMVVMTWLLMNYTSFGRYIYAIGGNREAAGAAGINVKRYIMIAYMFMGACTAVSATMLSARTNSGQPTAGEAYEFDAIIAAVLGGCSMAGGVGSVVGTFIGALIVGVINNCMNLVGISPYYQKIVKGVIIILAVLLDKKTRDKIMKAS